MTIRTIQVLPYNPQWPKLASQESLLIQAALGPNCITVHHIGSTAIPGLRAKPILDLLPVVHSIVEVAPCVEAMEQLGYESKGEQGMIFRRFFRKGGLQATHHVHVWEEGNPEIERHLRFRDWMRAHPEDALAYATLKENLAKDHPQNITQYCLGKESFISAIDAKSSHMGWRIVQALSPQEWAAASRLRLEAQGSAECPPLDLSSDHPDHVHLLYYRGTEIVGYAHLERLPGSRAALQLLVIDARYRQQGLRDHFQNQCERWLLHQGIRIEPPYPKKG